MRFPIQKRTLAILVVLLPLLALFVYVALRSGPLAPVPVTVTRVENQSIAPALFGIGTVEARYTFKIGPTFAGRIKRLDVQVGDRVKAGQLLGEMDPVDLDQRIRAQDAALKRAAAQLSEAQARQAYAQTQARRYAELLAARSTSEEILSGKKHELQVAEAGLNAAREESVRVRAERDALIAQLKNLSLIAPVDGLVTLRNAEPGTTLVAGQSVVELIDPQNLWVNVRFDQINARGLSANLAAQIVLRTQARAVQGSILRVEPLADAVTEEILAKVEFDQIPETLPAVGELAEVTVALPALAAAPVIPNAAIQRIAGQLGVWQVASGDLHFTTVTLGAADLEGHVQISEGLEVGDQVVVYSAKTLTPRSSIDVVEQIPGVPR
ncbi:efflux RND transporter periplasmic adaptor subunit [Geopsychrobacter electrodiphilus]|uniref:efflux RND transporter periplasmic adaptor subunit n=1 Tax=Geopsychrobacter electrodiphilus TaxID=225196 RepID=UPI000377D0E9|nr:efflux RND transporter periplasmic adaptor subunit [Geopsychrobacter electrodiphilus]